MSAAVATSAGRAKIPSLARRIFFGSLRLVLLLIVFVAIPLGLLQTLSEHGITPPYSLITVSLVGVVLAVLGSIASVARPTRAYGPLALAASVIMFLYLLALARNGTITFAVGSGATFQLSYGSAILLVAIVPLIGILAHTVTTAEDLRHPGERLPYDYPP
jgi:hypothetical protein